MDEEFMIPAIPAYIYKILSKQAWEASLDQSTVPLSENDKEFIHFSAAQQVEGVIQKFWPTEKFIILAVSTAKLPGRLVFEENRPGGDKYYHLYEGHIPKAQVKPIADSLEEFKQKIKLP